MNYHKNYHQISHRIFDTISANASDDMLEVYLEVVKETRHRQRTGTGKTVVAACALGLLIATQAQAQITKVGDRYDFRVHYVAGQKIRYQIQTTTTVPTGATATVPLSSTAPRTSITPMDWEVVSVKGKVATIKISAGPITIDNKIVQPKQTDQKQVDEHNKVVGRAKGEPAGAGLPPRPLKVGESYSIDQTMQRGGKPVLIRSTYTFKGIKTVDGKPVAEIDSKTLIENKIVTKGTSSTIRTNGTSTIYLLVADGTLFRTRAKQKSTNVSGAIPVSNTTESIITRLP